MGVFEKLSDYLARERDLAELDAMRAQTLNDLALDPAALRQAVLARPRVRRQMDQMAERFGLAPEDISSPYWREMDILHACQNCGEAKQCARFLNGKATDFGPSDCPNAEVYADIAAESRS